MRSGMLAKSLRQQIPLFAGESKAQEEPCLAAADGVAKVEKIVLNLVLRDGNSLSMWQFHPVAPAGA
jgi:hypothetical protein